MLQTETTVQTNVRREDRFGGYRPLEASTDRIVQPSFMPFSFSAEIPANQTQVVEPQTAFEVEKQYSFDKTQYQTSEPQIVAHEMEMPSVERKIVAQEETVYKPQAQTRSRVKLNARGKIMVAVYSIVVAIITAFCIYNAVAIGGLQEDIVAKSQIVASQTQVITGLQETYNSLGEDNTIMSQVDGEFKTPEASDVVSVSDFEMTERPSYKEETNWFEDFCEALKKLFS